MIILLMGPQGSGKDTEGLKLSQEFKLPLISPGDLLRHLAPEHPKYALIKKQMDEGVLGDYQVTADLIIERISQKDCDNGYILDGWCRNPGQFKFFDPKPDVVLFLNISREESLRRLSGRRICEPTGEIFNIFSMTTQELAKCTGRLVQREDDTKDAINKRLDIFSSETMPVVQNYKLEGKLVEVDARATPDEVHKRTLNAIEQYLNPKLQ